MRSFWQSPAGKYPPAILPALHSEVEPAWNFDRPGLRKSIPVSHSPEWLEPIIRKALAGDPRPGPSPVEFVGWFREYPGEDVDRGILYAVICELYRQGEMVALWKLRDTLGVSVCQIAETLRSAKVTAAYPCLWINRYAWTTA